MSSNELRFGIVIPNHNYGRWVKHAIDSAVADPYPNKQIAVIDDGSTDNSWEVICNTLNIKVGRDRQVLTGYVGPVPCLAFRYPKAGGPSKARNTGIKMLWEHTDIYGFLDSDDEYRPGKIAKSIDKFKEDPLHVGAVYTDYDIVDETGLIKREFKEPFSRERLMKECIVHSACIIKKEVFDKLGMYEESLRVAEDYDLWLRISEAYCLIHIPEALMLVRTGKHNSTSTVPTKTWQDCHNKVFQRLYARTKGQNG